MKVLRIIARLEERWSTLPTELGRQWNGFAESYDKIVIGLSDNSTLQEVESAVKAVFDLLGNYEFGRALLQEAEHAARPRIRGLSAPANTLGREEDLHQICNRLREMPANPKLTQVKKNRKSAPGKDKSSIVEVRVPRVSKRA
jgi:hypothetical protein